MFFNYKAKVVLKATGKEFILKENNKPFLIRQFKNNTIYLIIILSEAGLHGPDVTPGPNPVTWSEFETRSEFPTVEINDFLAKSNLEKQINFLLKNILMKK